MLTNPISQLFAIGALALCTGACARPVPPSDRAASSGRLGAPAATPATETADIADRLGALAGSVRGPAEITASRVQSHLGIALNAAAADGTQSARGALPGGVAFAVRLIPAVGSSGPGFRWAVAPAAGPSVACALRFSALEAALETTGYVQRSRSGAPLRSDAMFFDREQTSVMTVVYTPKGSPKGTTCVKEFDLKTWHKES